MAFTAPQAKSKTLRNTCVASEMHTCFDRQCFLYAPTQAGHNAPDWNRSYTVRVRCAGGSLPLRGLVQHAVNID